MASKKQKNRPTPPPARLDSRAGRAKLTELHQIMLDQIRDKNPARRYINGPQIMEQLGVSKSTMLRLIATMRDDYKLPVDHIKERGGYGYTEEVTEFPAIQFSQAELIAIFAALNSLKSIRGNPFNDSARSAFEKLSLALKGQLTVDLEALKTVVYFRSGGFPAPVDGELIETAVDACIDREEVILHHRKNPQNGEKPKPKTYRLKPYFVYCAGEVWYLYAWDYQSEKVRKFALARTNRIERTSQHFKLPRGYDPEKILGQGFGYGLFGDDKPLPARVHFNSELSPLIRERIWHSSQKITAHGKDGESVLHLHVSHDFELINWIRGWGKGAAVLEPESLRDEVSR